MGRNASGCLCYGVYVKKDKFVEFIKQNPEIVKKSFEYDGDWDEDEEDLYEAAGILGKKFNVQVEVKENYDELEGFVICTDMISAHDWEVSKVKIPSQEDVDKEWEIIKDNLKDSCLKLTKPSWLMWATYS